MNVQEALLTGIQALKDAGIEDAGGDARRLLAASLGVEPGRLTLMMPDAFDPLVEINFFAAIVERQKRRPVSHLVGYRDFYGRRFSVSSDVLDPRGDTETLVAAALEVPFERVLDLGTGSGCIILSLLAERACTTGVGTDVSEAALSVAARNAGALGLADRISWIASDWFTSVVGSFDLIVSNPPYISADEMNSLAPELAFEPRGALTDEGDGLAAYRVIAQGAGGYLKPGGRLMVEIGWQQGRAVMAMMQDVEFEDVQILSDLDGRDRVVTGQKPV